MNIPKVTHTPRVEAKPERWESNGRSVERDGEIYRVAGRVNSFRIVKDGAIDLLACLAAALGREVVEKKSEAAGSAPTEQMEHRGMAQADAGSSPAASPRPKFVKVTDLRGGNADSLTVGKVYEVKWWLDSGRPEVTSDEGISWILSSNGAGPDNRWDTLASWVPADDPCEPSEEEWSAALHGYATCSERHGERVMEALRAAAKVRNK